MSTAATSLAELLNKPIDVVWIVSYPRSGNTWVRFLLYAYLHGPINSALDVGLAIPNLHRGLEIRTALERAKPGDRLLIKTHGLPIPQHPLINRTKGFIYIMRHPKDVLLSGINIHQRSGMQFAELDYARSFIKNGGDLIWSKYGFGWWETHADAWLATPRWPGAMVKYEDMVKDAREPLAAMARLIGVEPTPERLDDAIKNASFEKMRALEEQDQGKSLADGLFMKPGDANKVKTFVNKGKTGRTLAGNIPGAGPDLDAQFDARFAPALKKYGYTV